MIDVSKYTKVAEYKDGNLHWLEDRDINAVYLIMIGDDSYIGSSKYLYTRIQEHVSQLRRKEHTDKMQEAFNSKGCFDVYSVERGIDERFLLSKEMQYIRSLNPTLNTNSTHKSNNEEIFKLRVKDILQEKDMTQKELAALMGKSPQYIANILNAKQGVSTNVLVEFAKALNVEFRDLFATTKTDTDNEFRCPYCGNLIKVTKDE